MSYLRFAGISWKKTQKCKEKKDPQLVQKKIEILAQLSQWLLEIAAGRMSVFFRAGVSPTVGGCLWLCLGGSECGEASQGIFRMNNSCISMPPQNVPW